MSGEEHRLQTAWTFYYDKRQGQDYRSKSTPDRSNNWDSNLKLVGTYDTVEKFWGLYNYMVKPVSVHVNANYHLFKWKSQLVVHTRAGYTLRENIKPMWEDDANRNGGKWILNLKHDRHLLDTYWENLVFAMVGGTLDVDDEVTGAVMSRRKGGDRISIWNRTHDAREKVLGLGTRLRQCLQLPGNVKIDYIYHSDSLRTGNSFNTPVRYTL